MEIFEEFVSLSEELPSSQEEAPAKDIDERHVSADSQIKSSRDIKRQEHIQKHPKLCKAPGQLLDKKAKPLSGSQQEDGGSDKPADGENDCLSSAMEKLVESAHFGNSGITVDMFILSSTRKTAAKPTVILFFLCLIEQYLLFKHFMQTIMKSWVTSVLRENRIETLLRVDPCSQEIL